MRRAVFVADTETKEQKKYWEYESDLDEDEDVVVEPEAMCKGREIHWAEEKIAKEMMLCRPRS